MRTTIHREGDRVWLEGVEGWFIGAKESSVHASQEAIMRAVGEDVTYDYLVGVSGLAFRMQVHKEGLCPSSPHPCCGYECVSRSDQALPWMAMHFEVKPDDPEAVKGLRAAVVNSIDRGVPVQYGSEEEGLVVGYQKVGEEWVCLHPMRDEGKKTFVETNLPWGVSVFLKAKEQRPTRADLDRAALEQAVAMAHAKESGGYWVGFEAWEQYIAILKSLDAADDQARQGSMLGNAWIYECLAQYRDVAAKYLREVAGEFPPEGAAHLQKAAELYDEMANRVLRDEEHCVVTIAPYAFALKPGETWTAAQRAEQVRRLEAAFSLERRAVHEIEEALNAK